MRCIYCKEKAFITLPYNRERLCRNCFSELFEDRVRKNIRVNRLLGKRDRVAVALSGGKDSSVALYILNFLKKRAPKSELIAITVDQGISKHQDEGVKAAKKLCRQLDVEHHIYSFKKEYGYSLEEIVKKAEKLEKSPPPCTYCGVLRRKLLNRKAKELCVDKIATGHNLDDEVQASMMNYVRGEIDRIARMSASVGVTQDKGFIPRIKPLRVCPENEVLLYAKIKEINFTPKNCPYSGEAFRGTIRKIINDLEKKHPGSKFQMLKSTDKLASILRERGFEAIPRCRLCGEPSATEKCKSCQIIEILDLD